MKFHEKARAMHSEVESFLNDRVPVNEVIVAQETGCFIASSDGDPEMVDAGKVTLVYSLVDPDKENTSDAQLVRAGTWRREDCGSLKIKFDGKELLLARINPEEEVDVARGWITEKGDVILRR